ncbi:MAG: helix-turn-helix domain-containing protein [Burkholderiaceae bacterium]
MKRSNEVIRKVIEEETEIFRDARRLEVALNVRRKLREKGLRSSDLAQRIGVSEANVSRWLRGNQNLSIDTLYLLADALEEKLHVFIGEMSDATPNAGDTNKVFRPIVISSSEYAASNAEFVEEIEPPRRAAVSNFFKRIPPRHDKFARSRSGVGIAAADAECYAG